MKQLRILEAHESGHGILIEMDAGWVSPKHTFNANLLESTNLDYRNPFEFYAVLQKYDTPNRNGRFYPERILKREAEKYKTLIEKGLSTSELNHPESSLIDLDRVSHIITEVWWDKNILMGKLKLLTSPGFHERGVVSTKGDQAANLMRQGVTLGISSRGVGSLKKVGERNEVQDDFELICFDLVSSPSTPGAYLFTNKNDREKYDENLEEELKLNSNFVADSNKSIDLMKKLNNYLKELICNYYESIKNIKFL
jgi:hypothetical protein